MADTYTTYYHSPVGLLKISGTENYISEVSFHDKTQKAEGKNVKLSEDKKKVTITASLDDFMSDASVFEYKIKY